MSLVPLLNCAQVNKIHAYLIEKAILQNVSFIIGNISITIGCRKYSHSTSWFLSKGWIGNINMALL